MKTSREGSLSPEQWQSIKELTSRLLDLPQADRHAYLQAHCNDPIVRLESRCLLTEYERDEFEDFPAVDRFVPRRRVGAGTFGTVYEAYDAEQQIVLALKVLKQKDPSSLERFKREFWTLREIDHPNLAKLYQLCQHEQC